MSTTLAQIRPGAYFDSIVLMQLQAGLARLPGVEDAGAVMGTEVNLAVLAGNDLLPEDLGRVQPEDLIIVVRAQTEPQAREALERTDDLLTRRGGGGGDNEYRPRSLNQAVKLLPEARWVLISVPGRFATGLAGEALSLGKNVFLYSDNISLEEELRLKTEAATRGLLVMGPDCGTATVGGVGFGFANRVRRGNIGLVAASGTGLQAVASRIHALGGGISQALGTGGRDLSEAVQGRTALAALDLLAKDPETQVIVLLSKPPAARVSRRLIAAARACGKPTIVAFQGASPPPVKLEGLSFASNLSEAADLSLAAARGLHDSPATPPVVAVAPAQRHSTQRHSQQRHSQQRHSQQRKWLRGLFSGGTLALEALLGLRPFLEPLASNLSVEGVEDNDGTTSFPGHTLLDLGADEFTVGRLHPMIDPDLRVRRLQQETADPDVAAVLLDVVLGDGSHEDPAGALAPAIRNAVGTGIAVIALLVGTDEDPQDLKAQGKTLEEAGAQVFTEMPRALGHILHQILPSPEGLNPAEPSPDSSSLASPPTVINLGLESFHLAAQGQGATALHVDWKPPAGGNEKLMAILARL